MYIYSVAARYMLKRPISYVAMLLVMLVVSIYLLVISVLEGFKDHYMVKIQSIMAHVTVDVGNFAWGIEQPDKWSREVRGVDPDIKGVTVGIETPAMAIFSEARTIGTLRGVDLDKEFEFGRIKDLVKPESVRERKDFGMHDANGRQFPGCICGGAWKKLFNVKVGDRITFLFPDDAEESSHMISFYVIGFYEGSNSYLENQAYVDRKLLADYMKVTGRAKTMYLWTKNPNRPDLKQLSQKVRDKMTEILTRDHPEMLPKLEVESWQEKDNSFYKAVTRENLIMRIIMYTFLFLTMFIFYLIFSRLVAEKVRDIGTLRALGASPAGIRKVFLVQGVFIGGIGLMLGLGLAEVLLHTMNPIFHYFGWNLYPADALAVDNIPYITLNWDRFLITALTIVSALAGAFFPARRASNMNPVECLRHE